MNIKASWMSIALCLGLVASSCSQSKDDLPIETESQQGLASFSLELGIDEVQERSRALSLTSDTGTPVLSQMAEGTEVPVHLFFHNGAQVSYVQKTFKVTAHKTLKLDWTTASLNGFTSNQDNRPWYVCGYIGGTPINTSVNNNGLHFSAQSLKKVVAGGQYDIAYPYAFPWKSFKWADVASTDQSRKPFKGLMFQPQGTLLRLRLTYRPTAAPYSYKVTRMGIKSSDLTTTPSVQIDTTAPTAGSLPLWRQATTVINSDNDIEDVTLEANTSTDSYWFWAIQTKPSTEAKFQVSVTGEPEYPTTGNVVRSLLKQTETANITLSVDRQQGVSPAYNVVFNPERPLLPLEFMAYGDANGNKSEAADGFNRGNTYLPYTNVYNSLSTLMKENRYLPTTLDMSSAQWSSVPDRLDPTVQSANSWFTWQYDPYDYSTSAWNRDSRPYEAIEILQDYTGSDEAVKKLKYSNHTLQSLYYHVTGGNVVYGLRLIGDGNKRLSAWRYERVSGSGIKIEAVYLGPKWEYLSEGNLALRRVNNESFWATKRAENEVITRYLNQKPAGAGWRSIASYYELTHANLGRYIVSTTADNRGESYHYMEFDQAKVWKVRQRAGLTERSYPTYLQGYVRFFKLNPYKD